MELKNVDSQTQLCWQHRLLAPSR